MHARCLSLIAFFTLLPIVQGQTLQWAQATGGPSQEVWKDVAIDGSGNTVTVGTLLTGGIPVDLDPGPGQFNVLSISSSYDVFFRKVDANGNFLWGGSFGGTTTDAGLSVAVDASDNVFFAGSIVGLNVDLDPTAGVFPVSTSNSGADAFVVKLSSSGAFVCGRIFGGLGSDVANAIAVDGAGAVWITGVLGNGGDLDPGAGSFPVTNNGLQDVFISKLDGNGTFLWGGSIGGTANDIIDTRTGETIANADRDELLLIMSRKATAANADLIPMLLAYSRAGERLPLFTDPVPPIDFEVGTRAVRQDRLAEGGLVGNASQYTPRGSGGQQHVGGGGGIDGDAELVALVRTLIAKTDENTAAVQGTTTAVRQNREVVFRPNKNYDRSPSNWERSKDRNTTKRRRA